MHCIFREYKMIYLNDEYFDAGVGERERAGARTELCNTRQGMGLMGYSIFHIALTISRK
jgi:hypothetical protein